MAASEFIFDSYFFRSDVYTLIITSFLTYQVALWIVDFDGSLLPTNPSFIEVRIKDPHVCRLDDESWSYTLCTVALAGKY